MVHIDAQGCPWIFSLFVLFWREVGCIDDVRAKRAMTAVKQHPALRGVPVVVLSNNDGCCIARSQDYVESELSSILVDCSSQRCWAELAVTFAELFLDE